MKIIPIWFAEDVDTGKALRFADYRQCAATGRRWGFVREIFHTKLIDIDREERELLAELSAGTRYKIRRAAGEEIVLSESDNIAAFMDFFNTFSGQKGLSYKLRPGYLERYGQKIAITVASKGGKAIVMHAHLRDPDSGRTRLFYSASVLRSGDKAVSKTVVGFANRALHFHDLCLFKKQGFRCYDMGGYAAGTGDPELAAINRFKDEFGGVLAEESNYRSLPLHVAIAVHDTLVALREKLALAGFFGIGSQRAVTKEGAVIR